jgi:acetyl-CoA acetyltransferase
MGDAVIVSAARTAIGSARKGSLSSFSAFDLARFAVQESLKRSNVPVEDVDDIVIGEVLQGGGDIARYVAIELGMLEVPGLANNRHCATSLASVQIAAASIRAGMDKVVIAGGTESITQSPSVFKKLPGPYSGVQPWLSPSHPGTPDAPQMDMSITVGWNTAKQCNVTREEQDHWAYHSHMRGEGRDAHLRCRRAPATRHHAREAGIAAGAAPRDRGVLDHRGERVGVERRVVRDGHLRRVVRA